MSVRPLANPLPTFIGLDGQPLSAGSVYFGQPNRDPREDPVAVYYDREMKSPARQPLRTSAGYLVRDGLPAMIFAEGDYSVLVLDVLGRGVFYAPTSPAAATESAFVAAGRGAGRRNLQEKLRDVVSVKDFLCDDGLLVHGDGLHDDTTGMHRAFDHAIAAKSAVYFPAGKYRVTSGYINSVPGADLVLKGEHTNYSASTGANAGGSCILLDSIHPASFFYSQSAVSELSARHLNFACSTFVLDRAFFRTSAKSVRHTFENINFTAVEQPFVYELGTYMQMSSYRNVRFTNSGSFHSRTTSLIATLVVIDNVDVEGAIPTNSEKVVCNLSGMRNVQGRNVLIEPALPSTGWTALRIRHSFAQGWVRYPNATFHGLYIECTTHEPSYVVEQIGNHVTYNDCHLNLTPTSRLRLAEVAQAEIHCMPMAGSSSFEVDKLFVFGDAQSHVTLRGVNTLNIGSAINHPQIVFEDSALGSTDPYVGVCFDNKLSQVLWQFDGGFLDAGKVHAQAYANTCVPSTDARYGRKLVLAPGRGGTFNTIVQARLRGMLREANQFWFALHLKLPVFGSGTIEVPFYVDGVNIGGGKVFTASDAGREHTVVLPATLGKNGALLAGFALNGSIPGGAGPIELYYAAIGVGRSVPNAPVPSYSANVYTFSTEAPSTGTWEKGDYCRNSAPAVGRPKGWYCTAAGMPGKWVPEGSL